MVITDKQQNYCHYHQERLININILLTKKYFILIKFRIIKIAKFTYFPLGKPFEKQIKTIKIQGKKHITAIEKRKKQVFKSNAIKYHEYDIEW